MKKQTNNIKHQNSKIKKKKLYKMKFLKKNHLKMMNFQLICQKSSNNQKMNKTRNKPQKIYGVLQILQVKYFKIILL